MEKKKIFYAVFCFFVLMAILSLTFLIISIIGLINTPFLRPDVILESGVDPRLNRVLEIIASALGLITSILAILILLTKAKQKRG